jgi:hypothetical protein
MGGSFAPVTAIITRNNFTTTPKFVCVRYPYRDEVQRRMKRLPSKRLVTAVWTE